MILFEGTLLPDEKLDEVLEKLWDSCVSAIEKRTDMVKHVMDACDRILQRIKAGNYDEIIQSLLQKGVVNQQQLKEMISYFDRENLQIKYDVELGVLRKEIDEGKRLEPLGILFHIAAGNAEGLPFYSVLEGLLSGNVNILKLPSADDGLSVRILYELVTEEPALASYVCVLDVPSTNLAVMKQLGDMADGIVVWGGDEAVRAVRSMADPATQIISWGHKLSFAYATSDMFDGSPEHDAQLYELAKHICETRQLLCSSCQGIFVDTEEEAVVLAASERFLNILEEVNGQFPKEAIGIRGKMSIALYNEQLEAKNTGRILLRGKGVSVTVDMEQELILSHLFKNCWVKPLPKNNIIRVLKGKRGYLQTVGLLATKEKRKELTDLLVKAGVTRIAGSGNMSSMVPGAAHDGEYPLRRYCRIVEVEK